MLYKDEEWSFEQIENAWEVIEKLAVENYNLDVYPTQIEIISPSDMLQSYCCNAMPVMYNHWSFGKRYAQLEGEYLANRMGFAYEVVINTNPCIAYLLDSNTMTMQTMVLAHAGIGHNNFFKNNYLFKQFTNANSILDFLTYAKEYVNQCEQKYGIAQVENILDKAHSISANSVDTYTRPHHSKAFSLDRKQKRILHKELNTSEFDVVKPKKKLKIKKKDILEDNLLFFVENNTKVLKPWQIELVSIVRKISQYFYPQIMTKVMNEGWATFWHYTLMTDLWENNDISEGHYLKFIRYHTNVAHQHKFSNLNPYVLGYSIFNDIKRMCNNPTAEDEKFFPDIVNTDWRITLKEVMENNHDASFIAKYLSPKIVRDLKLFSVTQLEEEDEASAYIELEVMDTQADESFINLRRLLSHRFEYYYRFPRLEVLTLTENKVILRHKALNQRVLKKGYKAPLNDFAKLLGVVGELSDV